MKSAFAIITIWFSMAALPSTTMAAPGWLAFGDIRGFFEPCGCDPRTDLGGVQRIQAHIGRERLLNPDVLVFNLGNAFSIDQSVLAKQKNSFVQAGLGVIAPDVSLLNQAELMAGPEFLTGMNYVLSNYDDHKGDKATRFSAYKSMIEVRGHLVFGFVESFKGSVGLNAFNVAEWRKIKANEPRFAKLRSVLLFSGSRKTLAQIVDAKIFDVVISGNEFALGQDFSDGERTTPNNLIRLRKGDLEVLKTPLGGQGVLRSPELQLVATAKPLSVMFAARNSAEKNNDNCSKVGLLEKTVSMACASSSSSGIKVIGDFSRNFVYWLTKEEEEGVSKELLGVVGKFREASSSRMNSLIAQREIDLKDSKFVGNDACAGCHSSAVDVWKNSKHSHAFQTLKDKQRTSDPDCVSCHVVGFSEKGGFVSEEKSPQLANVQCESCHGPRKDHVTNPSLKTGKTAAKDACATCHTPPHSPGFDNKKYWEMIKHK
jgi:Cytochrome c554 and c-prime